MAPAVGVLGSTGDFFHRRFIRNLVEVSHDSSNCGTMSRINWLRTRQDIVAANNQHIKAQHPYQSKTESMPRYLTLCFLLFFVLVVDVLALCTSQRCP
jgi:hypothetical protein